MRHYYFLDRPAREISIPTRIQYILAGILAILVDYGILYILYGSAAWVSSLCDAPMVVTLVLLVLGLSFCGGIIFMLFVLGAIALYIGILG